MCGTLSGFGFVGLPIPGVRHCAATPGFVLKPRCGLENNYQDPVNSHWQSQWHTSWPLLCPLIPEFSTLPAIGSAFPVVRALSEPANEPIFCDESQSAGADP